VVIDIKLKLFKENIYSNIIVMTDSKEQYKKQYSRDYYAKRRADPGFLEKKREYAKKHYKYARKTIDCPTCKLRHAPDSQTCILVREQTAIKRAEESKDFVEALLSSGKIDTE
jgi:hypothetical protein